MCLFTCVVCAYADANAIPRRRRTSIGPVPACNYDKLPAAFTGAEGLEMPNYLPVFSSGVTLPSRLETLGSREWKLFAATSGQDVGNSVRRICPSFSCFSFFVFFFAATYCFFLLLVDFFFAFFSIIRFVSPRRRKSDSDDTISCHQNFISLFFTLTPIPRMFQARRAIAIYIDVHHMSTSSILTLVDVFPQVLGYATNYRRCVERMFASFLTFLNAYPS